MAPPILLHVVPPSVLTCHWYVPEDVALNMAFEPLHTVWSIGWPVIAGPEPGNTIKLTIWVWLFAPATPVTVIS